MTHGAFRRLAARREHLGSGNPLRALTDVIAKVPDGINLGQGVCDLDTPRPLVRGAVESIEGGDRQTYTPYRGLPELRAQISARLRAYDGLDVGEENVAVTLGSSGAFFAAVTTLCEPGDEVVLFEPFYSYHRSALRLCGVKPVCARLEPPAWHLDSAALRAALSPRTRAVVVNTPANPSGKMFDESELRAVAELLEGTEIVVLTDEVYEYMVFDGRRHVSPATVPGLAGRTLTIGGYSKTFSITGWRIGYLVGPPEIADAVGLVCDQIHVCPPRPMQRGVARALRTLPAEFYEGLRAGYERKRDRFCAALEKGGFRFVPPQGAYYVLADYGDVLGDVEPYAAVRALIDRIGINAVPGDVFFEDSTGVRSMRFQFAVTDDVLDEACRRLRSV